MKQLYLLQTFLLTLASPAAAQQKAIYIYRNDG